MEKKAEKFLSLFSKLAVVLLSFFMNNLSGLSLFINNIFKRSFDSEVRVCRATKKQAESRSSKDKEKRGKRKCKSRVEDERSLPPSDSSDDVVCREDLHDAGVEKRRKTLKSRESNTVGNEDKEKSRKRESNSDIKNEQTRKEKHRKKDRKRKGEQESGLLPKKFKDANLHSAKSVDSNDDAKDVSKNEAQSRRRKREDMDAAEKDSRAPESHNPEVKRGTVPTKKRGKRHRDEDIADMVSQKQAFDDEDKLYRSVFVRSLPVKTKKQHVLREFSQFGEVESVVLIAQIKMPGKNGVSKKKINEAIGRSYAYVIFKNEQAAHAALSHNMTQSTASFKETEKLRGKNHFIYDAKWTVFVRNLPFDVKDEVLYQQWLGIKP